VAAAGAGAGVGVMGAGASESASEGAGAAVAEVGDGSVSAPRAAAIERSAHASTKARANAPCGRRAGLLRSAVVMAQLAILETKHERLGRAVHVLALSGDLDAHTFPAFQERLERTVAEGARAVVIDGKALAYVSSAGLGVLKRMVKDVRADGGDIRLAALTEKIRNIMNLLGFSKIIQVFSTVEEAVESF